MAPLVTASTVDTFVFSERRHLMDEHSSWTFSTFWITSVCLSAVCSWTSWYGGGAPTHGGSSGGFWSKRDDSNSSAYFGDAASTPSLTRRSDSLPRHLSSPHGSQPPVSADASVREASACYETTSLLPSFLLFTSVPPPFSAELNADSEENGRELAGGGIFPANYDEI